MSYINTSSGAAPADTSNASVADDHGSRMHMQGGVLHYSLPAATTENLRGNSQIQMGMDQVLTVGANGTTGSVGTQTVSSADIMTGGGDLLSTARNGSFPAMGNLNPNTVVSYQGLEVDLATLESMGVVKRTASGYEEANTQGGTQQGQQQQAQQNTLPEGVELFSTSVETQVAQAIDPVPQAHYDAAVAMAIENGLDGINFNELAYQSGITPEEARGRAEVVFKAFSDQADGIAKSSGVDNPQELWEWARTERPEAFARASREMAFGRNTQALRALAQDYFQSEPPSIEALQKAGIPLRTDHAGETVAFIRGNWMTPASAAKAGLI